MSSETNKQTHILGKTKKLIDLNGDSINFELSFTVTCKDDTLFNVLVIDQLKLDNGQDLVYKECKKTISGNIVSDKNFYQNYFLILKSEIPCEVEIEIVKKNLPITNLITNNLVITEGSNQASNQGSNKSLNQGSNSNKGSNKGSNQILNKGSNQGLQSNMFSTNFLADYGLSFKINLTHILIAVICIGVLMLLFYLYKNKVGKVPEIHVPEIHKPEIHKPEIHKQEIHVPEIHLGKVQKVQEEPELCYRPPNLLSYTVSRQVSDVSSTPDFSDRLRNFIKKKK
jgi:hypothetical protein